MVEVGIMITVFVPQALQSEHSNGLDIVSLRIEKKINISTINFIFSIIEFNSLKINC
jgi:hypothetical protein